VTPRKLERNLRIRNLNPADKAAAVQNCMIFPAFFRVASDVVRGKIVLVR